MKTKTIPFDLELAKKIQAGEIEGRIKTREGGKARILCTDIKCDYPMAVVVTNESGAEDLRSNCLDGKYIGGEDVSAYDLFLEVPDEVPYNEPKESQFNLPYSIEQLDKLKKYTEQLMEVNQGVIDNLDNLVQDLKRICEPPEQKHEFKPFEQVLVRQSDNTEWRVALYSHFNPKENLHVTAWLSWYQCIPYEGNEHLVGTTDKPKEE